jgi:hypothetical protein
MRRIMTVKDVSKLGTNLLLLLLLLLSFLLTPPTSTAKLSSERNFF